MSQTPDSCPPLDDELGLAARMWTIINLDDLFANDPEAKVINTEVIADKKAVEKYTAELFSDADKDLGFVPTCRCGATHGTAKEGVMCPLCGTQCSSQFVNHLSHSLWIMIPQHMPPVLHPVFYAILQDFTKLGKRGTSVIDLILNPDSSAKEKIPDDLAGFLTPDHRGMRNFYEHHEEIMQFILHEYPRTARKPKAVNVASLYAVYKGCMFTRHLPILHSSLHPRKSNGDTLKCIDPSSAPVLTAIGELCAESFQEHAISMNQRQIDSRLYRIYVTMVGYYQEILSKKLGSKVGLLRKHDFGSRVHFTFRSVVVPQDRVLPIDEVLLPWGVIVNGLKLPILNFLVHREFMTVSQALDRFMKALNNYDPLVDKCITDFINEAPDGKLCILLGRNPTLAYGSIMQLFVREFKKDPHDETIGFNACICKPANIDFDGDELYAIFVFEKSIRDATTAIHPSQLLFSTSSLGLSSRIGLLDQNTLVLENYLEADPDTEHYEEIS